MQIKTTASYHHIPVRMASSKKSTNKKHCSSHGLMGTLQHHWLGCKCVATIDKYMKVL